MTGGLIECDCYAFVAPRKKKNDPHPCESDSSKGPLTPMTVPQQFVHRRPPDSATLDRKNPVAFIESGSDCLLTPAAETQLSQPVKTTKVDAASLVGVLQQLELLEKRQPPRIALKAKGKILFMETADIIAVHAQGNCASLKCGSTSYFVRESLCSIAVKLCPYGFIQIRRSVLVNISLVEEIQPLRTSEYRLRLSVGGTEYVVTRKYKENLRSLAPVWFGTERVYRLAPAKGERADVANQHPLVSEKSIVPSWALLKWSVQSDR